MTTKKIKELDVPVDKQSGSYTAIMSFSTPSPGFVYVQLTDQDGNELWRELITESPVTLEVGFSHTNLTKLILNRFESNAHAVTSYIFELYWTPPLPPITCDDPTPNHASGCALLLFWDKDNDGIISHDEMVAVTQAYISCEMGAACPEPISLGEITFIDDCYNSFAGVISDICPGCVYVTDICAWITGLGGWEAIMTSHIGDLVSGYLGVKDLGFTVTVAHIMGAVAYYLNNLEAGNSLTGCDFSVVLSLSARMEKMCSSESCKWR